jgi:hypothetical protein
MFNLGQKFFKLVKEERMTTAVKTASLSGLKPLSFPLTARSYEQICPTH